MKLVGDVIGKSIFTSKICTIGVGNWGKTWRREMLMNSNRVSSKTNAGLKKVCDIISSMLFGIFHLIIALVSCG